MSRAPWRQDRTKPSARRLHFAVSQLEVRETRRATARRHHYSSRMCLNRARLNSAFTRLGPRVDATVTRAPVATSMASLPTKRMTIVALSLGDGSGSADSRTVTSPNSGDWSASAATMALDQSVPPLSISSHSHTRGHVMRFWSRVYPLTSTTRRANRVEYRQDRANRMG